MINNLRYVTKADCINCDFMQAKEIDNKVKKIIRQYADSHGISIPRKHGGWTSQASNRIKHNGV